MYIRRKVFSVVTDETTGEEKLFSTTEVSSKKDNKAAKIAAGAGAATALAGGGAIIYNGEKIGNKINEYGQKALDKINETRPRVKGKFVKESFLRKKARDVAARFANTQTLQNLAKKVR